MPISKKSLHFKDVDMNPPTKRTAPEGTTDRDGNAGAKNQIASEQKERKQLEPRVRHLEQMVPIPPDGSFDEVDKSIAVVGGLGTGPLNKQGIS